MKRLIVNTNNCGILDDWAAKEGLRIGYNENPVAGDLVMFDFKGSHKWRDHVGIVTGYSGDIIYTIEGNTSISSNDNGGAVMRRNRYRSQITSFIRPEYNSEQTAKHLVDIASSQIGVKESPSGSNNVKYNTWYYGRVVSGDGFPWCCVFVEWCFAVLAGEISDVVPPLIVVNIKLNQIQKGWTGNEVKTIQRLLRSMGYRGVDSKYISDDGDFGNNTDYAVKNFQRNKGLVIDGIVGEKTWEALLK